MQISDKICDKDIALLVRRFYELNLADPLLAPFFSTSNQKALRAKFARLIVSGLSGAPMNRAPLRRTHYNLGIGDIEFAACGKNLLTALGEQRTLDASSVSRVVSLFWDLESEVITPTDQLHAHQSVSTTSSAMDMTVHSSDHGISSSGTDSEDEVYMNDLMQRQPVNSASHHVPALSAGKAYGAASAGSFVAISKPSVWHSLKTWFRPV
ncbi:hypothetical protein THASP1DRAFT_23500 [Thamnocephalis sphaerospora]|uniref:Globin n=1 Tax=Thamnocephalis sphaerospora TaxID=78915 RepID=A0A4P9XR30_9FUNG|nr:hypothetical protein THASP1DRAFT_23500 [Thamnocephalis sphaerospora]|eukprot:RKP08524.1 hypothetical protein THASP1DRAFT_23500 [Thamnocephalis sphaerospora]